MGLSIIARPAFNVLYTNPYNWLLYTNCQKLGHTVDEYSPFKILRGNFDIWHLHWPEHFLNYSNQLLVWRRLATTFGLLTVARIHGIKLIWTVHNLQAHERLHPRVERWFWRKFIPMLDGYIYLSRSGKSAILKRFPELETVQGHFIPHGHYRGVYPDKMSREASLARLELTGAAPVVAYVGQIRPYKNVPHLIRTFKRIENPDITLLVAGKPVSNHLRREIIRDASDDARIRLKLDFVPPEDVQLYMRASDLVVLPFTDIFNSGSAILALSFGKPILVPRKGALGEIQGSVGDRWVRTYDGELCPAILSNAIEWALKTHRPEKPDLEYYDWRQIAVRTTDAYREVCNNGRSPHRRL